MKRCIFSFIIACVSIMSAMAQLTATNAFTSAPSALFPLLDKNTRLDMVDYYNSGSDTPSTNALSGSSRITSLTPMDIRIDMTESTSYQIAILPTSGDSLIMVIETMAMPAKDSRISFYDSSWTSLGNKIFAAPTLRDWLNDNGRKNIEIVEMIVPFLIASYDYDTSTGTLTLTNNLPDFVSKEDIDEVNSYFLPSLSYRWTGKKFSPVK